MLSGAAPDWRQRAAMDALDEHLVRRDLGIIQLLTPPFDHSALQPGYIKGYLPGVRETAASTPTPPCGPSWPSPSWATRTAPGPC